MKIQRLSELKQVLNEIPDEVLREVGFGFGEGQEETIGMCIYNEDFAEKWSEWEEKYPNFNLISKWINKVIEAQNIMDAQEDEANDLYGNSEDAISSDTDFNKLLGRKVEDKKSSS